MDLEQFEAVHMSFATCQFVRSSDGSAVANCRSASSSKSHSPLSNLHHGFWTQRSVQLAPLAEQSDSPR